MSEPRKLQVGDRVTERSARGRHRLGTIRLTNPDGSFFLQWDGDINSQYYGSSHSIKSAEPRDELVEPGTPKSIAAMGSGLQKDPSEFQLGDRVMQLTRQGVRQNYFGKVVKVLPDGWFTVGWEQSGVETTHHRTTNLVKAVAKPLTADRVLATCHGFQSGDMVELKEYPSAQPWRVDSIGPSSVYVVTGMTGNGCKMLSVYKPEQLRLVGLAPKCCPGGDGKTHYVGKGGHPTFESALEAAANQPIHATVYPAKGIRKGLTAPAGILFEEPEYGQMEYRAMEAVKAAESAAGCNKAVPVGKWDSGFFYDDPPVVVDEAQGVHPDIMKTLKHAPWEVYHYFEKAPYKPGVKEDFAKALDTFKTFSDGWEEVPYKDRPFRNLQGNLAAMSVAQMAHARDYLAETGGREDLASLRAQDHRHAALVAGRDMDGDYVYCRACHRYVTRGNGRFRRVLGHRNGCASASFDTAPTVK